MAGFSVNTNVGAMIALQNLNKTNNSLEMTQNRINTGLKVSSAKDNGAIFAIAQTMRAEVAGINGVKTALDNAVSAVDVALSAGSGIGDLLIEMKEKAVLAADSGLTTAQRTALDNDFQALKTQVTTIVSNAEFNGINMIKASGDDVVSIANSSGTNTITVAAQDLSLAGLSISANDLTTGTNASTAITAVDAALTTLNSSLGQLGTGAKALSVHSSFVGELKDSLERGVGNLVDADLAVESARLQSLQVKQQLGLQALSIANSAPQTLLGLFR
ncbi:flagellin [Oceanibacterium hippocampi]|uniref:Flagellin n=1 Tax=Oceanibacterium hippocampi TaxID=745714 RepID=A0A1Y5U4N1_9PROT|nr:flagellin [Oceanibacterium hippocampi]SLN77148.1 Flagellin [Oceanibacterium hippocampi]